MAAVKEIYEVMKDAEYQNVYYDVDEWRSRTLPDGTETKFRYVHGGIKEKNLKFSFCFPEKKKYTGRFFQLLSPFPGPDEELASLEHSGLDDHVGFSLMNGAYFVESNMCSSAMFGAKGDNTVVWKSSAAAAEYSRITAVEMYQKGRPYGYVFGGSGGGYKTMACIENTNAWDGAVPFVIGSPVSLPNSISLHAQAQRCLRRVFPQMVDALEPGGSGNMYVGLSEDESMMLKEILRMGFPPKAWFIEAEGEVNDGALPVLTPGVKAADPTYFEEFWTVQGYMGADKKSNACRDRLQFDSVVRAVHLRGHKEGSGSQVDGRNGVDDAWKKQMADGGGAWIELEAVPQGEDLYLKGVSITFPSGGGAGKTLLLDQIRGECLTIGMCFGMDDLDSVLSAIQPGDPVHLDNSDYIAIQSYYRHQVPEDMSYHAWDQFRHLDGTPATPQRERVMGYGFTGTGIVQDGDLQGKVIVIQSLMDESTWPWCGDWYRRKVMETMGTEEGFRIYYMEHCLHGEDPSKRNNHIISYSGALMQALLDVSDWVERGIQPNPSSAYSLLEGQISLVEGQRKQTGIQAAVTLTVDGRKCCHVKAGETVTLRAEAVVPKGAGRVTGFSFASEDHKVYPNEVAFPDETAFTETCQNGLYGGVAEKQYVYEQPGIYFASVRVQSNRQGETSDPMTQIYNLDRIRVVVEK